MSTEALVGLVLGSILALAVLAGCGPEPCPVPCGEVCCAPGQRCDVDRGVYSCALRGLP